MKFGFDLSPRYRIYSGFSLLGSAFGSIFTRLGDIQLNMNVGQTAIGGALIGTAAGMMISVTLLSPYFERIGFAKFFWCPFRSSACLQYWRASHPAPQSCSYF